MLVEREAVKINFSDAAVTYNSWAQPQKKIAARLIRLLPDNISFDKILDIGCGTGNLIEQILQQNSSASITGVDIAPGMINYCINKWKDVSFINFFVDDIEQIGLNLKYNLIMSSCVLQWIQNFDNLLSNLNNILSPGGHIAFAIPIDGSFYELRNSYDSICSESSFGLKYSSSEFYLDLIRKYNFQIKTLSIETEYGFFKGLNVLKYFKKIGATFQHTHSYEPLHISEMHKLIEFYESTYKLDNGLLPVTHKILYLIAEKN